ncbi:putative ATPase family AAA domain-containing protein 2B isoform X18 [Apostichopus japonicus]|uniref:Putative ATPase family AAA domain-containing protein 2B isoform X18 n=1 Tax=Stichopus japonicus TaxID=307972 RepID=A0A2G8JVP7_STIJA|nr:putative ATPase family AAA domain-containing protein 2B isoform X18 [Apostichopus japonicus]
MNLKAEDVSSGVLRDRQKIGSSLADVDPMNIDTSITFESVGGLNKHIQALKEMVVFPLLYPEVFTKFKINPPRGVLFHGPPGTGKTLVARALANECKNGDKKVAFFMRKGADCLSKWVGESERQLRLLFDQAYTMRPSIIFFDEIDGLAPVRSSRQDQIHSSIVSTLLALMDGLDCRGEIVVIGATNRIDSIDPALRRPGRFDREFLFQLPSCQARKSILSIHTSEWNPKLADSFLAEVAERCVGYCGADLKALCTETALYALRHQFPQIYASKEKLQLDLSQIQVSARDFHLAMQNIVPAAQRAVVSPGRALSVTVRPLLKGQLDFMMDGLKKFFPVAFGSRKLARKRFEKSKEHFFWKRARVLCSIN